METARPFASGTRSHGGKITRAADSQDSCATNANLHQSVFVRGATAATGITFGGGQVLGQPGPSRVSSAPAGQSPRLGSRSIASQLIAEGGHPSHGTPSASPAAYASTPALTRADVERAGGNVTRLLRDMQMGPSTADTATFPPAATLSTRAATHRVGRSGRTVSPGSNAVLCQSQPIRLDDVARTGMSCCILVEDRARRDISRPQLDAYSTIGSNSTWPSGPFIVRPVGRI